MDAIEIANIASRIRQVVGDEHIHFSHRDPYRERYHFKHKKTGKEVAFSKELLKSMRSLDPDSDDPLKKHLIDLFA